jgi:hypothetical protein
MKFSEAIWLPFQTTRELHTRLDFSQNNNNAAYKIWIRLKEIYLKSWQKCSILQNY